jgi:hypothetical protein
MTISQKQINAPLLATVAVLGWAHHASAEMDYYFGAGIGLVESRDVASEVPEFEAKAVDVSLALTAGLRTSNGFGIEANADILSSNLMEIDGSEACNGQSPTWCEIGSIVRLRGTASTSLDDGSQLMVSGGLVRVTGVSENNPGNLLDTIGQGISFGLSWQMANKPMRIDVNYDIISNDSNSDFYERNLEVSGIRLSYMF